MYGMVASGGTVRKGEEYEPDDVRFATTGAGTEADEGAADVVASEEASAAEEESAVGELPPLSKTVVEGWTTMLLRLPLRSFSSCRVPPSGVLSILPAPLPRLLVGLGDIRGEGEGVDNTADCTRCCVTLP